MTKVTRCPKCETSFRVTDAHLKSAKGAVRCGSCLHIFNARDYIIQKEKESKPSVPSRAKEEEEDLLISDDMDKDHELYSSDADGNVIMATTFGPSESNLFERDFIGEDDDDETDTDESWAESLLEDDDDEPKEKLVVQRESEAPPPKREIFGAKEASSGSQGNFYGQEPPSPPGSKLSKDHFKLIEELRQSDTSDDFHSSTQHNEDYQDHIEEDLYEDEAHSENEYNEDNYEGDGDYVQTSYEETHYDDHEYEPDIGDIDEIDDYAYRDQFGTTTNRHYINAIEPEPVEFNVKTRYPIWHSKSLWTGLASAAGLLLFIQLAIFRFDDLSTLEPWRSYYGKACNIFSCELPQLRDRTKIKASNLVVRSHPTIENALMVDAIINNNAKFPQAFPPLDLVFVDIKNKPLAARRFEASEYLGGELAGKNAMPVNQPVHIAIEISDPGPAAVSYFITIPD